MRRVSDEQRDEAGRTSSARVRIVFAIAMLAIGAVPVSRIATAATAAPACSAATYTVVRGDSWSLIASRTTVKLADLLTANAATSATTIHPGQVLCLPPTSAAVTPTTTVPAATTPAAAVIPIEAFPVQGICGFADTYGAPRGGGRLHEGVDIIAKAGQHVYAVKDGTLSKQYLDAPGSLTGNGWRLTSAGGTYFFYAHLSTFAPGLSVGSVVKAGQIIGQVGTTGNASIAHLHFEVHPAGGPAANPTPTVAAVDACTVTAVLPQPGGTPLPAPAPAPVPAAAPTVVPSAPAPLPPPPIAAGPTAPGGNKWQFISSVVANDTGWTGKALAAGSTTRIRVNNLAGVNPATSAVLVRLSTRDAVGGGYLLAQPCDGEPGSSTLNFSRSSRANGVAVVRVVDGTICVSTSQKTHLRIEVIAFASQQGVGPQPITTTRALDTRQTGRLAPKAVATVSLAALGAPAASQAVSVTITVIKPSKAGSINIGACSGGAWKMSFSPLPVASYAAVVRVNGSGLCLTPSVATDVLIDVTAAWTADGALSPVDPIRLFDARTGNGTIGTTPQPIAVAGVGGVPADATVAMLNVTILGGVGFVYPCDQPVPAASALAASPGVTSAVAVPVRLADGAVCVSTFSPVPVVVDVIGAG